MIKFGEKEVRQLKKILKCLNFQAIVMSKLFNCIELILYSSKKIKPRIDNLEFIQLLIMLDTYLHSSRFSNKLTQVIIIIFN